MRSSTALQAIITGSAVALGTAVTPVWAQNSPRSGTFSFSTAVDIDSNPSLSATSPGAVFSASENLSFSVRTENDSQFLEFSGSTGLTFSKTVGGGSSTSISRPQGTLHYFRDGANANVDVQSSFWSGEVITAFDADPSVAVNIVVDTGTLAKTTTALTANWGINSPLSFAFTASQDLNSYSGTSDPSLFDNSTLVLGTTATARLSPTTQGAFSLTRTSYRANDTFSTQAETADFGFQLTHQVNATFSLNANLGYQIKSDTVAGATVVNDGIFGGIGFSQTMSTGSVFGNISYDATAANDAASLTLGRTVDFPLGSITGSITADWTQTRGTQILGAANFNRQFSDGSFDVRFAQSITTDNLSQDIKYSYLGIGYQKTLNSDSGIDLSLDLSRSEDAGGGAAATINRATLSTSYSRALNSDWNMSLGYRHRQYSGSAVSTADSDSVFFTLTKNLQFGF